MYHCDSLIAGIRMPEWPANEIRQNFCICITVKTINQYILSFTTYPKLQDIQNFCESLSYCVIPSLSLNKTAVAIRRHTELVS